MKKFNLLKSLILGVSIFAASGINAQTIVSTSPMNKRVVLEEYTGIHCVYCPDGHKRAHDIQVAHPGTFFPIAIHQGSYAAPSAGEPDYRTSFGNSLAGQTGLTGYPAGTINRHVWTGSVTDLDRTQWASYTNTALGQSSCVNVALTANVDYTTRELTVLVEVYYTANSTQTTNKLNVALCQNNVKGPQTGGATYNPTMVTPDGQYLHQHMLRHLLTGQWGVTIPTTTTGTFFTQTFNYTIPASYIGVPVELPQLEVIAFVTEGNQEILSADGTAVNQPSLDASISAISGIPVFTCTGTFTPSCTLKNNGTTTLTSATINYSIDGGTVNTLIWTGSLATGATANVTLPSITTTANGSHVLSVSTSLPNGSADMNTINDGTTSSFAVFSVGTMAPIAQNFTSTTFPPADYTIVDADSDGKNWARGSAGHAAAGSAYINFYSISATKKDDLILPLADFTNTTNTSLSFWVAYRQYQAENDKLQVDVSTNCGTSWTTKWTKQGSALSTGAATTSNFTSPTANEWRQETVDLSTYNGMNNVMIRFRSTSAYGNNLFLDDINLTGNITGYENQAIDKAVNVYPNPSNGSINITSAENSTIEVIDMLGNIVFSKSIVSDNEKLDLSNLANGSYFVRISNDKNIITEKIVLVK